MMDIENKDAENKDIPNEDNEEGQLQKDEEKPPEQQLKSITRETFVGLSRYSPYFFITINYLAHQQGFQILSNFIANTTNLKEINLGLEVISQVYQYIEEDYIQSAIISVIRQPLQDLPSRLTDEEIKVIKKEEINNLILSYEVRHSMSLFLHYAIEHICDNLSWCRIESSSQDFRAGDLLPVISSRDQTLTFISCLNSQNLEKRIIGITSLISIIDEAKKNVYSDQYRQSVMPANFRSLYWLNHE